MIFPTILIDLYGCFPYKIRLLSKICMVNTKPICCCEEREMLPTCPISALWCYSIKKYMNQISPTNIISKMSGSLTYCLDLIFIRIPLPLSTGSIAWCVWICTSINNTQSTILELRYSSMTYSTYTMICRYTSWSQYQLCIV